MGELPSRVRDGISRGSIASSRERDGASRALIVNSRECDGISRALIVNSRERDSSAESRAAFRVRAMAFSLSFHPILYDQA